MEKISRKTFLKIILGGLGAFLAYLIFGIFRNQKDMGNNEGKIEINNDLPDGISFTNNLIVNKNKKGIEIFSSKCPHMGCQIDRVQNNVLICPCHGSSFSADGKVLSGPAVKNLTKLDFKIINNKIVVFTG